ncbi:orotate phosphoribosyltransferase [Orrella daihaiensis]|uniref:Orotate phosphoribosyltransferase n=1 Tax=Orrella daihaiensis TaxID=2782176 RepID=A0ABY4AIR0_9BURK|nr:orotate phosphoribosyltransferase [Orrella daihaiensis]UOD49526.1 orotate phosphoribosyltransferase [Orrella daihaiensis]
MTQKASVAEPDYARVASDAVDTLLSLNAVLVWRDRPFVYTTGWASPVYVDCRKLMSEPKRRQLLMDHAANMIHDRLNGKIDVIAGIETAGIPFASWLADRLSLPMVYVRKKAVGWGLNAQIEGDLPPKARCLVVDDLTTDGLSKIGTANALRRAGATVSDVFVVFNYDIYPQSRQAFKEQGITLHALATWADVFSQTKARSYFSPEQAKVIKQFLADPIAWSARHGGADSLPAFARSVP